MASNLTAAQRKALKAVAASATSKGSQQYEQELPLNAAGVTIHFTPAAPGSNQGRFWFAVNGEDSGINYTTRTAARAGAQMFLDSLEDEPEQA